MRYAMLVSGNGGFSKFVHMNRELIGEGEFVAVLADRSCPAFEFFERETSIPSYLIDFDSFESREDFEIKLLSILDSHRVEALFLTYDRIVGHNIINAYRNRIFNLHLSLLPMFKGTRAQQTISDSYNSDVLFYGATVHLVDELVDSGAIISQVILLKKRNEDFQEYSQRLFENAAILLLDSIDKICSGNLITECQPPFFSGAEYGTGQFNPGLSVDTGRIVFAHREQPGSPR
jgi:phosphoribosylglycinamide formyltransferase 1